MFNLDAWSSSSDSDSEVSRGLKTPAIDDSVRYNIPQKYSDDNMGASKRNTFQRNLVQTVETILSSCELQEKYSTKLSHLCVSEMGELIKKKPEFFRMVESTLNRNINENKIKAETVPYIISIVSQLYILLLPKYDDKIHGESITENCSNIIKFLICVSIRENIIFIESETDIILLISCFDDIIDSCIKLLKIRKPTEFVEAPPPPPPPPTIDTIVIQHKKKKWCC